MALRRGFKTEANSLAVALRTELRLDAHAPLCPWKLAKHLEVPVHSLSDVEPLEPVAVRYLRTKGKHAFSAVTIFVGRHGRRRVIFHNDGHATSRQTANLAHELAHAILGHPPTPPFAHDPVAEEEAKWLGPALLIPDDAALHIVRTKMPEPEALSLYGVSPALLRMRLNVSAARKRISRWKR